MISNQLEIWWRNLNTKEKISTKNQLKRSNSKNRPGLVYADFSGILF
jgi:hypothetical protein